MPTKQKLSLTNDRVESLKPPASGERVVWCGKLPGLGVRMRAGGHTKTFMLKYRNASGRQRKMKLGSWPAMNVEKARKLAQQVLGKVSDGGDPAIEKGELRNAPTMTDLAHDYIENKRPKKRSTSLRDDQDYWDRVVLPRLGAKLVRDVTVQDIESLHRSLAATPYRANRVLALIRHAFNLAINWKWRIDNPARGVEMFDEQPRERYLTDEELARLAEVLASHPNSRAVNAVRLLMLTGARKGEVLSATWSQFDLKTGHWTKPSSHTKQKQIHRVPLSEATLDLLRGMKREADEADVQSPYLFPGNIVGKPLGDIKTFWSSVCCRAGIEGVRIHDLRHQFASTLVSSGLSLPIISKLLGHTQVSTTARYAHLFDDPLREAVEVVGRQISMKTS